MGLIDLPHISFSYAPKLQLSTKQTRKIPIVFDTITWEPLQFPLVAKKQRLNRLAEQDAQQQLITLHKQELAAIKEHNDSANAIAKELKPLLDQQLEARETMLSKLERINDISTNRTRLLKLLQTPSGNAMSLTTLPIDTRLYVYGVRYTNSRYGETVILAASTTPANKSLKLYWSNTEAKRVIDDNKDTWGFIEPNLIASSTNTPLCVLDVRETYYNKSGNKCVSVICLPVIKSRVSEAEEAALNKQTDLEQQLAEIEEAYKQSLATSPELEIRKMVASGSLEDVITSGDVLSIIAYWSFRKSYIVECSINNREPVCLKSNRFLDDILEHNSNKFKVMVGVRRTHPKSRRVCYSFVEPNNDTTNNDTSNSDTTN